MEACPVSKRVNSPAYDRAELLARVETRNTAEGI